MDAEAVNCIGVLAPVGAVDELIRAEYMLVLIRTSWPITVEIHMRGCSTARSQREGSKQLPDKAFARETSEGPQLLSTCVRVAVLSPHLSYHCRRI